MPGRRLFLAGAAALIAGSARADQGGILVFGAAGQTGAHFIKAFKPEAGPLTAFVRTARARTE